MKLFEIYRNGVFSGTTRAKDATAAVEKYAEWAGCPVSQLSTKAPTYADQAGAFLDALPARVAEINAVARGEPAATIRPFPATPVRPNAAFLLAGAPVVDRKLVDRLEARAKGDAEGAGAPNVTARLLALCPVSIMDAACELDVPYKRMRGHALALINAGRARMLRGKLVKC